MDDAVHARRSGTARGALAVSLSCLALLAASRASAADLTYSAPETCPSKDELEFQIARALDAPLESARATSIGVEVSSEPSGFVAHVTIEAASSASRERTLRAAECSRLIDALSVVIVLALGELEKEAQATETNSPDPAAANAQVELPADTPDPSPEATEALEPSVSLWLMADVGSLPRRSPALGLGVQLGKPRWSIRALGAFWLEQHVDIASPVSPRPGADLRFFVGGLSACHAIGASRWEDLFVGACVSWEMGRMSARGTGVRTSRTASLLWLAPGAALEARWQPPGSNVQASAQLGGVLPLNRNPFNVDDIGTVHRASALVFRAALGVALTFE